MASKKVELDIVLQELGDFGKYQKRNLALLCLPIIFTAVLVLSYVFTARITEHRCFIQECENKIDREFKPIWLPHAVPFHGKEPTKCLRYESKNTTPFRGNQTCAANDFNKNIVKRCDTHIYASDKITIVNDFNLTCEENHWKLTLVGTVNNIGQLICLPLSGIISDKFGRKTMMVTGILLSSVMGLIRSFSLSYVFFIIMEFTDTLLGSSSFSSGFVLAMELVGPSKRVFCSAIINSFFSLGMAILGFLAWYTTSWRTLLRIAYSPAILFVFYYWLIPDSIKWMISKGKYEKAKKVLTKAAKVNGVHLSEKAMSHEIFNDNAQAVEHTPVPQMNPLLRVLKTKLLLVRLLCCSFVWITCTFVYYGLSLNSVTVGGNIYINFIFVSLIEIPGYITSIFVLDRFGRKLTLALSLLFAGLTCLSFIVIPQESEYIKLSIFLLGKCTITVSFTTAYIFTTELFPTVARHSLLATCSMFGRIGSILAPQTPLLADIWTPLPLVMFGVMSTAAAALSITFPETLNSVLPDTVEEAQQIGQKISVKL